MADIEHLVTCSICLHHFDVGGRAPKCLPCTHTVCLRCLATMLDQNRGRDVGVACPECRRVHQIRNGAAENLPNNVMVLRLMTAWSAASAPDIKPHLADIVEDLKAMSQELEGQRERNDLDLRAMMSSIEVAKGTVERRVARLTAELSARRGELLELIEDAAEEQSRRLAASTSALEKSRELLVRCERLLAEGGCSRDVHEVVLREQTALKRTWSQLSAEVAPKTVTVDFGQTPSLSNIGSLGCVWIGARTEIPGSGNVSTPVTEDNPNDVTREGIPNSPPGGDISSDLSSREVSLTVSSGRDPLAGVVQNSDADTHGGDTAHGGADIAHGGADTADGGADTADRGADTTDGGADTTDGGASLSGGGQRDYSGLTEPTWSLTLSAAVTGLAGCPDGFLALAGPNKLRTMNLENQTAPYFTQGDSNSRELEFTPSALACWASGDLAVLELSSKPPCAHVLPRHSLSGDLFTVEPDSHSCLAAAEPDLLYVTSPLPGSMRRGVRLTAFDRQGRRTTRRALYLPDSVVTDATGRQEAPRGMAAIGNRLALTFRDHVVLLSQEGAMLKLLHMRVDRLGPPLLGDGGLRGVASRGRHLLVSDDSTQAVIIVSESGDRLHRIAGLVSPGLVTWTSSGRIAVSCTSQLKVF